MGIREDILVYINENDNMITCDDCITRKLKLSRRQAAYQKCNELESRGLINRKTNVCSVCGKSKKCNWSKNTICNIGEKKEVSIRTKDIEGKEKHEFFKKNENIEIELAIREFMNLIALNKVEIYNEFSFQHELGICLRQKLSNKYKIQFERNVSYFQIGNTLKKEMDIVIFNDDKTEKYCIELKFPTNGQVPEQMYSMCKDIRFLEQLRENGFTGSYSVNLVIDSAYYTPNKNGSIYDKFRNEKKLYGVIEKPTGKVHESIELKQIYKIVWNDINEKQKYFIVSI